MSELQLWIRLALMRYCPHDPGEGAAKIMPLICLKGRGLMEGFQGGVKAGVLVWGGELGDLGDMEL